MLSQLNLFIILNESTEIHKDNIISLTEFMPTCYKCL